MIIRAPIKSRPVTDADKKAYFERIVEARARAMGSGRMSPERLRLETESVRQMRADVKFPRTLPAFDRLVADTPRNLWVVATASPGRTPPLIVFDTEGRWLGEVQPPSGVTVMEIGPDYMLGVWKDADNVEYLRIYGLIKP